MFSISPGFNELKTDDEIGAPSKMNSGVLPALMEFTPRKRIVADLDGSPELDNTESPAT